jgi:hypothetical protein
MKMFCLLTLSLISLSAFAGNPKVFVGKYAVKNCPLYIDDYDRAYITVTKDEEKNEVIELKMYGQDAMMAEFVIGANARQVPGTDIDIHGVASEQTTVKWLTSSDVEIKKFTSRPSVGLEMTDYSRLELVNGRLTITSSYTTSKLEKCKLLKLN